MGSVQNKGSNQASTALTTATNAAAQNSLVVVMIAVDNYGTTDGDLSEVTGVVSSDGVNKWTKAVEFTNGQGTAQTGATLSIWWSFVKKAMPTSSTITASFTQQNSRDAVAMTAWNFSVAAKYHPIITGTPAGLANDAADPGSLNVTTGNISCLRVRGIATEQSTATALTQTASWTLFTRTARPAAQAPAICGCAASLSSIPRRARPATRRCFQPTTPAPMRAGRKRRIFP